jgi:KUP system potassium uptake protein
MVVEDLVANKEVNVLSRYESLEKSRTVGDFQFIVLEKYLSEENELPFWEKQTMRLHFWLKGWSPSEERGFGLDPSNVVIEKFPLIVSPVIFPDMKRVGE